MFFKKKIYEVNVICENCDQRSVLNIPKGTSISDHLGDEKGMCPNCGVAISLDHQQKLEGEGMITP